MSYTSTITAVLSLLQLAGFAPPAETAPLVDRIISGAQEAGDPAPSLQAISSLSQLLAAGARLGADVPRRLGSIVADPRAHGVVRVELIKLLCSHGSPEDAERVRVLITELIARLRALPDHHDPEYYALPGILQAFLEEGAQRLAPRLADPASLLDVYMNVLAGPRSRFNEWVQQPCFDRIVDNPAPLPVRQRYMLRVVETVSFYVYPEPFAKLVNQDVSAPLRKIAFEGAAGPNGYHPTAVALLAEYGDEETADRLMELGKQRGYLEADMTRVGGDVWRIRVHYDTQLLLDYIGSDQWIDWSTRAWAVQKALRLGVEKSKIREALLEYGSHASSNKRLGAEARDVLQIAVENGILMPGELPVTPLPSWARP